MFFFACVVISPHQTVSVNTESTLKTRPISDYYIFFLDKLKPSVRIDRGKSVSPRVSAVSAGDLSGFGAPGKPFMWDPAGWPQRRLAAGPFSAEPRDIA
jgi:hypothetical protein